MTSTPSEPRLYDVWLMWVEFLGYTADYRARYARMTWWKLRRQWFKDVIDAVKRKLASRDDTNLRVVLDYKE